ncbi:MAG: hypothetical protein JNL34_04560 [Anaerolineae bacterium]|nr:hypothetical protein [Anaerolineae bacterium]
MANLPPASGAAPTIADVARIAAVSDPVIRNLQITQCYHELAQAMAARTGPGANWCTFATWASKQAGQTIRREDLQRAVEDLIDSAFSAQAAPELADSAQELGSKRTPEEIQETVADVLNPLNALQRASGAVARGNLKVFAEIGHEFARFLAALGPAVPPDPVALAAFTNELRPGGPPDGQQMLRQAFGRYVQAFSEPDAKTRAELLLCANLEIGLHEQTRLQPEIREALDAVLVDRGQFRARLIKALFPWGGWWARLRLFLLRLFNRPSPFDALVERLLDEARRRIRLIFTASVMTLGGPGGLRLRLGADVPAPFPDNLIHVALPELRALLDQFDPTPDSPRESGAEDWAALPDRLHFIADLFRAYGQAPDWFDPPFTPAQSAALKEGHLPDGRL